MYNLFVWWLDQMAEGNAQSKYVKLTKDQDQSPLEDITPGELNQPIEVPQVWFWSSYVSSYLSFLSPIVQFLIVFRF